MSVTTKTSQFRENSTSRISYLRVFVAKKNAQLLERFRSCCAWKLQQAAKPWEQRKTNLDKLREKYTYFPFG